MKKYLLLSLFLCIGKFLFAQVTNDDCSTATYLYPFPSPPPHVNCYNGVLYDTTIISSNINATVSSPYFGMSGCKGYSSLNTNPSNDVWYKFDASVSFRINVQPWSPTILDTIHLNVWHGSDCSNLQPSGCFTYDFGTSQSNIDTAFDGNSAGEYTYLQFSGPRKGKTGDFMFCITRSNIAATLYYGTTVIATGIDNLNLESNYINIYPNPTNGKFQITGDELGMTKYEIEIYSILGEKVYHSEISNQQPVIDISSQPSGIYFLKIINQDGSSVVKKIIRE